MSGYDLRFGERIFYSELITPNNAMVIDVYNQVVHGSDEEVVLALWDYVCRNIDYPLTFDGRADDTHVLNAFVNVNRAFLGPTYLVNRSSGDWWEMPCEVLAWGISDCEGTSNLLCSLLRRRFEPDRVFVEVGYWGGGGHAWVSLKLTDWVILETTLDQLPQDPWKMNSGYKGSLKYNDVYDPGFSFGKSHLDIGRLRGIASIWGQRTKGERRWR